MTLRRKRAGLTLLEVLVSLVVIGVAVSGARAIADQLANSGRASMRALDERLSVVARHDELRRVFALAVAPSDTSQVFDGNLNDIALSTRCVDARGFDGACRCHLSVVPDEAMGSALQRDCDTTLRPDTLVRDSLGLSILYLVDAARGGRWIAEWRRTNSLPRAIGVIRNSVSDTLIVRIGERG